MIVFSYEGGAYMSTHDVLDSLGIPPNGGAQFVDRTNMENHTSLHVLRLGTSPEFHVTYRTHITDYPRGFHVYWKGFLFFGNYQVVSYETTTGSEFPGFSARQFSSLRRALWHGRALPKNFQHAITTELEHLWFHLSTWRRVS